jgi:hypothetical protein
MEGFLSKEPVISEEIIGTVAVDLGLEEIGRIIP